MAQMPNISFYTALTGSLLKPGKEGESVLTLHSISGGGQVVQNHKSYAVYGSELGVSTLLFAA